jgi:hypothetical protein
MKARMLLSALQYYIPMHSMEPGLILELNCFLHYTVCSIKCLNKNPEQLSSAFQINYQCFRKDVTVQPSWCCLSFCLCVCLNLMSTNLIVIIIIVIFINTTTQLL